MGEQTAPLRLSEWREEERFQCGQKSVRIGRANRTESIIILLLQGGNTLTLAQSLFT